MNASIRAQARNMHYRQTLVYGRNSHKVRYSEITTRTELRRKTFITEKRTFGIRRVCALGLQSYQRKENMLRTIRYTYS